LVADGSPDDILSRVEWLNALGLAPPRITDLMWRLQQMGEDVENSIFTVADAVSEISALLARLRTSADDYRPREVSGHV